MWGQIVGRNLVEKACLVLSTNLDEFEARVLNRAGGSKLDRLVEAQESQKTSLRQPLKKSKKLIEEMTGVLGFWGQE